MKNSTAIGWFLVVVAVLWLASSGHGKGVASSVSSSTSTGNAVVSQIDSVFGQYSWQAERVAMCESSDNPSAINQTTAVIVNGHAEYAQGLFQIIPSTWNTTSYRYQSPTDLNANIRAAYEIFSRDSYSWKEWQCKPYKQ